MGGSSVFVGVWQNYSKGLIFGSTITLEESQGDILQNVLALLVQSGGQSFWTIISYIIHQVRNNRPPDHPIFYQQQGVLRNSGSALTAALRLGQLSFNWRGLPGRSATHYRFRSTLYYIFIALLVSVGFSLASIFSSQVTKFASHEVLLRPNDCGFWASRNYTIPKNAKRALLTDAWAAMYANTCYKDDSDLLCGTYVVQKIDSDSNKKTNEKPACPFSGDICADAAWSRDTGLRDTATVLGVNAKPSDRLLFRKKATCAPLNLGKYRRSFIKVFQEAGPSSKFVNETVQQFYLGKRGNEKTRNNNTNVEGVGRDDLTYEYSIANVVTSPGYQLQALHAEVREGGPRPSDWKPIPDFKHSDADTVVFLLSTSGVKYRFNISDPFFRAVESSGTDKTSFDGEIPEARIFRARERELVTGIGCVDQYQICNPNLLRGLKNCTSLASAANVSMMTDDLNLNPLQEATALILNHYLQESGIHNTASSQGESALKAHSTSYSIQNNVVQVGNETELKWQNEVEYWFAASLASLQINFVQTIGIDDSGHEFTKPTDKQKNKQDGNPGKQQQKRERKENFVRLNQNPSQDAICASQLIHIMDGYQNFSLIGVILIMVLSILLVVLSLYIHVVGGKIQEILSGNPLSRVSWTSDGYLQIQRMAYEGAGYEGWQQCATDDVPISRDIEKLGGLDISDINHPRLLKAVDTGEKERPGAGNFRGQQDPNPTLSRSSTLTSQSKDLPPLPISADIFSDTVLDNQSHQGGQAQRGEEERRTTRHKTTLTSLSGMTSVDYYRPLPPLPLR